MNYSVLAYCYYAPIVIGLTIWVARMLHKNTMPFLNEIFKEHTHVAAATNNLLQVGFYLISLGYAFVRLKIKAEAQWVGEKWVSGEIDSYRQMIEQLAVKVGAFTLLIGFMLFLNLFLMLLLRRSGRSKTHQSYVQAYQQQMQQQQSKPNPGK